MVSKKTIRRLRLREGDILVVKDHDTMEYLTKYLRAPKGTPPVQIVFAPNGIHRVNKEYLRRLVNTDSPKTDAQNSGATSTK